MAVIYETPLGSPLSFKIETTRAIEKANFAKSDWNNIMRAALKAAGDYWMGAYLPLRFANYARAMGIYTGKKARGMPLVKTGYLRETVGSTARATATATANTARIVLEIPLPNVPDAKPTKGNKYFNYTSNPVVNATLSAITQSELDAMSEIMSVIITSAVEGANVRTIKSTGRVVAVTSPETRQTLAAISQSRQHLSLRELHRARLHNERAA